MLHCVRSLMARPETGTGAKTEPASLRVLAILTSPEKGAPMIEHDAVRVDERGIVGDRYPDRGYYHQSRIPDEDRGITIISSRGIEEANEELQGEGIADYTHGQTRRSLVVDIDVAALNSLKGRKFRIGDVEVEGTDPCTPCARPGMLNGRGVKDQQAFVKAFVSRGGLRLRPLKGGTISVGSLLRTWTD
jgi:MOSC domain-containing protein YiiM